jgi:hypothetical protein
MLDYQKHRVNEPTTEPFERISGSSAKTAHLNLVKQITIDVGAGPPRPAFANLAARSTLAISTCARGARGRVLGHPELTEAGVSFHLTTYHAGVVQIAVRLAKEVEISHRAKCALGAKENKRTFGTFSEHPRPAFCRLLRGPAGHRDRPCIWQLGFSQDNLTCQGRGRRNDPDQPRSHD